MKTENVITLAETMGIVAHEQGKPRIPALDPGIKTLLTPQPSQANIDILKAWHAGWVRAMIARIDTK